MALDCILSFWNVLHVTVTWSVLFGQLLPKRIRPAHIDVPKAQDQVVAVLTVSLPTQLQLQLSKSNQKLRHARAAATAAAQAAESTATKTKHKNHKLKPWHKQQAAAQVWKTASATED